MARPGSGWGGQQLLLALGGFLLLSGTAFFLAVVWDLIGVTGQAIVMGVLTLSAAGAARAATRRGLGAAAETAACIAVGLLVLDFTAARNLGLWGLDDVDGRLYFGVGALLVAALLYGFDLLVPRAGDDGEPLRRIETYRPIAAVLAAAAAWTLFAVDADPGLLRTSGVALAVGLWGGVVALFAQAFDRLRDGREARLGASAGFALMLGVLAVAGHWFLALVVAYGPAGDESRWLAMLILAALPVATLAVLAVLRGRGVRLDATWWWVALVGLAVVAGVPLWAAPRGWLLGAAVVVTVVLVGFAVVGATRTLPRNVEVGVGLLGIASGGLWLLLLALDGSGAPSMPALLDGDASAGDLAWWAPVVPVVGLWVTSVARAFRSSHTVGWVAAGWALAGVGVATSLRQQPIEDALLPVGALAAAGLLSAFVVPFRARGGLADSPYGITVEGLHLSAGALFGVVALAAAAAHDVASIQAMLLVLAAGMLLHAFAPRRLFSADVAVFLGALVIGIELADRGVEQVEAYVAFPALGWLVVGVVRFLTRQADTSWAVVAAPILAGLFPSLFVSLAEGAGLRTLVVTAVAVAVLLAGCACGWKAPVVLGAVALLLLGWTWGGMWVSNVPGWLNLTVAGAVLLSAGVWWEKAAQAGRIGSGWVAKLW